MFAAGQMHFYGMLQRCDLACPDNTCAAGDQMIGLADDVHSLPC